MTTRGSALPARSRSRLREAPASAGVGRSAKAGLNLSPLARLLLPDQRVPPIAALVSITGKEMLTYAPISLAKRESL
jgi:hypothetical protein